MMNFIAALLLSLVTMGVSIDNKYVLEVTQGNNEFTFQFLKEISDDKPTENIFCSPLSVSVAMGMAYIGSSGDTKTEIQENMHYPLSEKTFLSGFRELISSTKNVSHVSLNLANTMYVQKNFEILQDFQAKVTDNFLAPVGTVDFADSTNTANKINAWVADQTNQKIKNVIDPSSLSITTRIVVVNAMYFKGNWKSQFKNTLNQKMDFHLDDTNKVSGVEYMRQTTVFPYAVVASINAKVLAMPYEGDRLEMIVILPDSNSGLNDTLNKLITGYGTNFHGLRSQLDKTASVQVSIPKFKLETSMNLNDYLKRLGMATMFGSEADFSGIDGNKDLFVSEVVQKAFIDVNEEGSEAAAATGWDIHFSARPAVPPPQPIFRADHPFIYVLWDNDTKSVVFAGIFRKKP